MTTLKKNTTIEIVIENGFNIQDKICVFCSNTLDRWDSFCHSCQEYKGVMNVVEAVDYYGVDILGL
jgi:predicted amidophosphoribosyltransferase